MQSCVAGVYAAGDACTIAWTDKSPHWFQMRLWTQASSPPLPPSPLHRPPAAPLLNPPPPPPRRALHLQVLKENKIKITP